MPGTLENLALPLERDSVDLGPDDVRAQPTAAKRSALMRTDVAHREKPAVDVEHADASRAAIREDSAAARGNLVDATDDAPTVDDLEGSIVFDTIDRLRTGM